jgi:Fic family protein
MTTALNLGDEVTPESILEVQRVLLQDSQPDAAGAWRREQVWIGTSSVSPHHASYVPPRWEAVPSAIRDLCEFAARGDMPVLVQAAITHAQFETIHPFVDGNGRTGRVLMHTVLRRRGLVRHATVPISAGLLRDTASYVGALTSYRHGDVDQLVRLVCDAALTAIGNGRQLASDISGLRTEWLGLVQGREGSAPRRLVDQLFAQPVVNAEYVQDTLQVSDVTALRAISELEQAGVLTALSSGRRNRVWQASGALKAIDAFADRAGRRVPH